MYPTHNLYMHFVYVLKSMQNGSLYFGCTSDLKGRVEMHNKEESHYTKKYVPWKLLYYEAYVSKDDAFRREHALKHHAQGLRHLKERLAVTLSI